MSRRSYIITIICVILSAIFLNILLFYNISCTGEYIVNKNSEGYEYVERLDTVRFASVLFSECDVSDYSELKDELLAEKSTLNEYMTAWEYKNSRFDINTYLAAEAYSNGNSDWSDDALSRYNYSYEQAEQRSEQLDYCISRLDYALGYPDYTEYVTDNSEKLLTLSMLSENSFAAKNAIKTKRDFYGLEAIKPTAESDIGVINLFSDSVTDIIAVLCAVITAFIIGRYMKGQTFFGSSGLVMTGAAVSIGTAAMYVCNGVLMDSFVGLGDLLRPIQSAEAFRTSSLMMNVFTLIVLRILFKVMFCAAVYYIVSGITISDKKAVPIIITAISALLLLLCPANVYNAFHAENIFGVYGNLNILGNAVSPQSVFIPMMLIMLAVSIIFSVRAVSSGALAAREAAEYEYYAEVGRKYEETRKIRHDINNHLSALGILLNEGKTAEAKAYLGEISEELALQKPPAATGRPVLDALLLSKVRTAENENIKLEITIGSDLPESIPDYDLCGIFGNIIDNAIEACEKCEDRYIQLAVKKQLDMLCIFCENSYVGTVSSDFETSKSDRSSHGFGIKRIEQLAEKHGGIVKISADNGIFSISVLIQN
ncbi:MAG: sensor histidine kinase [Oscillospiraceae bacterium]